MITNKQDLVRYMYRFADKQVDRGDEHNADVGYKIASILMKPNPDEGSKQWAAVNIGMIFNATGVEWEEFDLFEDISSQSILV